MNRPAGIDLILASTSRYRRELLGRIAAEVRCVAPAVDEARMPGEAPAAMAARLAHAKANAVALQCRDALVIGSDQVADLDGHVLGKPGSAEAAHAQLRASSGRVLTFHTAVTLIDTRGGAIRPRHALDTTRVAFRALSDAEIARYLAAEQPYDCAGSFKAEGLGIALFERIQSDDPTALIGLPLIALGRMLREAGVALP